jgi:hypothetical protein
MDVAAAIVEAANRSHDRDDLIRIAESIVAPTSAADAASIAWAVLLVVARLQTKTEPRRRLTWRPSQVRRRKFAQASHYG